MLARGSPSGHDGAVPAELPPTYARGVRASWVTLPAEVRAWVEEQLGGPVVAARDAVGGFSPGCAAVVRTAGGATAFCKAVSSVPNPVSLSLYRRERDRLARLPDHPALPKPLAGADLELPAATWTATLLPALPGETPAHPWTEPSARLVFDRLGELQAAFAAAGPSRLEGEATLPGFFGRWSRVLDDPRDPWSAVPWVRAHDRLLRECDERVQAAVLGDLPAHADLRADNVLVARSGPGRRADVWFVDWAEAQDAAPWVDPALLACDLVMSRADLIQGGSLDVARFLATHPVTADLDPGLIRALMLALAAALHRLSRQSAQPGLPTIRGWQARCAEDLLGYVAAVGPLPP